MGRLTALKPRLKPLSTQRVQSAPTTSDERIRGGKWQRIRDRILTRDNGICQCEECRASGRVLPATQVDHVRPLWEDGSDEDDNLQAINADCHKRKSAEEAKRRGR
jgi:5-methylcytosine-specific restriction protein A